MSRTAWIIALLFIPAGVGLLGQVLGPHPLDHQLLALGLLLFCLDQARMATVDLTQVAHAKQQQSDPRLARFTWVTISTIALELGGFYLASWQLGVGIVLVLLSQIWFNLLAGIQLQPAGRWKIRPWGVSQRLPILMADGLGLGLVGLWQAHVAPLTIVLVLWSMAIAYSIIKIGLVLKVGR